MRVVYRAQCTEEGGGDYRLNRYIQNDNLGSIELSYGFGNEYFQTMNELQTQNYYLKNAHELLIQDLNISMSDGCNYIENNEFLSHALHLKGFSGNSRNPVFVICACAFVAVNVLC